MLILLRLVAIHLVHSVQCYKRLLSKNSASEHYPSFMPHFLICNIYNNEILFG